MSKFKRKTEQELNALTMPRLKAYYKAEQKRYNAALPFCCEFCCDIEYSSKEEEQEFNNWHAYVMFVKAIMKTKENGKEN